MTTLTDSTREIGTDPPVDVDRPILSVVGLTKRFAEVLASDHLSLDFYRGEVHAVLGENGAGKSTLMKMLYGFYRPDEGHVFLDGERVSFNSPADARKRGVGMVFQNFTLIPALTVVENIALVNQTSGVGLDVKGLTARIKELSTRYGLEVDPGKFVRDLSIGEQQRVEILKALSTDPSILILDEPTSVLAPHEVASLLDIVRRLRDDGFAVILITHKLGEVFACANRCSVLRRGQFAGTGMITEFDQKSLLTMMLGETVANEGDPVSMDSGAVTGEGLMLSNVSLKTDDGRIALRNIDIEIRTGEIVGIAAVSGNGQASLGDAFLGTGEVFEGTVQIGGRDMTGRSPAERLDAGLNIIPEDPIRDGSVPELMVSENLNIGVALARRLLLRPVEIVKRALTATENAPFPLPAMSRRLGTLSGGNVQRVVIARELSNDCRYLLAYYPTRGLDLASTRAVRQRLIDLKDHGGAVLLVSEDLDELRALCDRIVVLFHGAVVGTFKRDEVDVMGIGRLMTGGHAA